MRQSLRALVCCCVLGAVMLVPGSAEESAEDRAEERSIVEQWREVLQYGIDEEVVAAVDAMDRVEEQSLNRELLAALRQNMNQGVRLRILTFFTKYEWDGAVDTSLEILREGGEELPSAFLSALLRYLSAVEAEFAEEARSLVDHFDQGVAISAIKALAAQEKGGEALLERLEDPGYPEDLKPELILALGQLEYGEAFEALHEIADDTTQPKVWRMYAADSLGKIGNEDAVPLLQSLFAEDDALMRAYAASALSRFDVDGVRELLEQALRDNNWRVRVTAVNALAERKDRKSAPILIYKAKRDPVPRVRLDAIRALGEIGGGEAFDTLRELYAAGGQSLDIRTAALNVLVEKDLGRTAKTIEEVLADESQRSPESNRVIEMTAATLAGAETGVPIDMVRSLLSSPNPRVRIHAIRAAVNAGVTSVRDEIQSMAEGDPASGVRREALAALERL